MWIFDRVYNLVDEQAPLGKRTLLFKKRFTNLLIND